MWFLWKAAVPKGHLQGWLVEEGVAKFTVAPCLTEGSGDTISDN